MTSIKVKLRPSECADREGTVYYQIIHHRLVRQLATPYKVFPKEWDERRSMVYAPVSGHRKELLLSVRERIRRDLERLHKIVLSLEEGGMEYSSDDVIDEFKRYASEYSLFNFMSSLIARLIQNGKIGTSEKYKSALNSFRCFRVGEDIMLDALSSDIMEDYQTWLMRRGVAQNSVSFYARILRAAYNRAVEMGAIDNSMPFRRIYTGVDKTIKRALHIDDVKRMKDIDLSLYEMLDFARDMFLMSFYLRGMSFIDMAFLKKSDLRNGAVSYRRHKTGQMLSIEWRTEMQRILDKYPENESEYLLPIIKQSGKNEWRVYRNAGYNINRNLKKIAHRLDIKINLTMYVARHSWASIAKAKGIPISVISEGMGHDSESTTQIYLASLDSSVVDTANRIIISAI